MNFVVDFFLYNYFWFCYAAMGKKNIFKKDATFIFRIILANVD